VEGIETPIGTIPKYDALADLFRSILDKEYTEDLYTKQFSLYVDNIIARIDLQLEKYGEEKDIPSMLFDVLKTQKQGLEALKDKFGPVVTPTQLAE